MEDGILDETEGGFGLFEGREAIRAFFRDSLMANSTHVVHMMFNHLITSIEGGHGEGRVNCLVEIMKTDGSSARAHVAYNDRYVRDAGRWKFASIERSFSPSAIRLLMTGVPWHRGTRLRMAERVGVRALRPSASRSRRLRSRPRRGARRSGSADRPR